MSREENNFYTESSSEESSYCSDDSQKSGKSKSPSREMNRDRRRRGISTKNIFKSNFKY